MRLAIAVGLVLGFWGMSTAVPAQDSGLLALRTSDATRGWEGVGRIDIGQNAFCSGALIAPDLVLTAAHCLFDKETRQPHPANDLTFLAGWRDGRAVAYRSVKRAMTHPSYVYKGPESVDGVQYDLAILQLDQPIRLASITPYLTGDDPQAGEQVEVVSYAFDRAEAPSLQRACHVLGPQPGMTVFTCSVDFGSSGAPIFRVVNGQPQIVSVVSAKAELDGQRVSIGPQMADSLAELRTAFADTSVTFRKVTTSGGRLPQITPTTATTPSSGAKFLTP